MPILRDDYQACLAGLNSDGSELVRRYRDLLDSEALSNKIRDALQDILFERQSVMQRLAELQRGRGELPKAGDPDRAFLHSIADWAHDQVLGDAEGTARRLREADKTWLKSIDEALVLEWDGNEQRALNVVREHVVRTLNRLEALSGD